MLRSDTGDGFGNPYYAALSYHNGESISDNFYFSRGYDEPISSSRLVVDCICIT